MDLRNHPATVAARRRIDLLVLQTRLHIANQNKDAAIQSCEKAHNVLTGWLESLGIVYDHFDIQTEMSERIWSVGAELTLLTDREDCLKAMDYGFENMEGNP